MLIDDNLISLDYWETTTSSDTGKFSLSSTTYGIPVSLNGFLAPGKSGPIPLAFILKEKYVNSSNTTNSKITVTIQQTSDKDVVDKQGGTSLAGTNSANDAGWETVVSEEVYAPIPKGTTILWRFIPHATKDLWIRFKVVPSVSSLTGPCFAAVVREEDFVYHHNKHLLIDKGVVQYHD